MQKQLPCNIDRFNSNLIVDRNCQLCNKNIIGDEFHFLFECDEFNVERTKYVPHYYITQLDSDKLNHLFNSKIPAVLRNLSKFANIIMERFNR